MAEERFKTTLMGGFDKDDVLAQVKEMQDNAIAEKGKLQKKLKEKEKEIEELNRKLEEKDLEKAAAIEAVKADCARQMHAVEAKVEEKDKQIKRLQRDISEKYQKYIDRYDLIGDLVFQAQERAEQILVDAEQKRDMLMIQAREEAQKCLDGVQAEVDEKLAEGKRKYVAVQEEMNEIIEVINQAQKRFMSSYKEVHRIVSSIPESVRELEEVEPEEPKTAAELEEKVTAE